MSDQKCEGLLCASEHVAEDRENKTVDYILSARRDRKSPNVILQG